jgi:hypothetical protein
MGIGIRRRGDEEVTKKGSGPTLVKAVGSGKAPEENPSMSRYEAQ